MMKTISILLALVNSLIAGLLIAYHLSGMEIGQAALLWSLTKASAALAVIAVGALTWLANMRTMSMSLLSLGSTFLVALGAATVVWTYHTATLAGNMDFHMIFFGASLMMQGMASLLGLGDRSQNITAPQS